MGFMHFISGRNRSKNNVRRHQHEFQFHTNEHVLEERSLLSVAMASKLLHSQSVQMSKLHQRSNQNNLTPRRWQWLSNTYWYVPQSGLNAIVFEPDNGSIIPVKDQTLYHISGYRDGYFWGETVAQYGDGAPMSASLIGSVTPQGKLLLSFNSGDSITQGIGTMTLKHGRWTMENQMFTGTASGQVGHWAYMVQTRPGTRTWNSLPFVNESVPSFLSNYNLPKPKPII